MVVGSGQPDVCCGLGSDFVRLGGGFLCAAVFEYGGHPLPSVLHAPTPHEHDVPALSSRVYTLPYYKLDKVLAVPAWLVQVWRPRWVRLVMPLSSGVSVKSLWGLCGDPPLQPSPGQPATLVAEKYLLD